MEERKEGRIEFSKEGRDEGRKGWKKARKERI